MSQNVYIDKFDKIKEFFTEMSCVFLQCFVKTSCKCLLV